MKYNTIKIPEEQRQRILQHLNDRPRSKAARLCGVSIATFYRYARQFGAEFRYDLQQRNTRYEDTVRQYYPTMSAREIEDQFNIPRGRVEIIAKRIGVSHTPETAERIERIKRANMLKIHTKAAEEKRYKAWMKKRKMEEFRVMSGLPQQTKFKIATYPTTLQRVIRRLETERNYFRDEEVGGLYTLFYDEQTRRSTREHLYTKRYRLKFKEA